MASVLAGAWRRDPPPLGLSPAELAEVAPLLLETGAGGLLWPRLAGTAFERTAEGARLQAAFRYQALTVATHARRMQEAMRRLRAAGVEAVVGKGWVAASLYPLPGFRPCGDIDLFVRRCDHATAAAVLAGAAGELVDLHEGFAELDDRPDNEILARSRLVEASGGPIRVFGPEDHLRLLALHALRHGILRPLWLCDVAAGLESAPSDVDWDWFAAGGGRRTEWAFAALEIAHAVLDAATDAVPSARRSRLPSWIGDSVLVEWGAPRVPHGAREPMAELLRRPRALARGLRLRWPNAVEATVHLGWPVGGWTPLPAQVAECVRRTASFARPRPYPPAAAAPDPGYNPAR